MRNIIKILTILLFFYSCTDNRKTEILFSSVDLNNSAELQNFILSNPESVHFSTALDTLKKLRKVEYYNSNYELNGYHNRFRILLNQHGKILLNRQILDIERLSDSIEYCLTNSTDIDLPEMRIVYIGKSQLFISSGIVTLKSDNNISQESYSLVVKEINECFNTIKETWSIQFFGIKYHDLEIEQQELFDRILQSKIILEEYFEVKEPKPAPYIIIENDTVEIELKEEI